VWIAIIGILFLLIPTFIQVALVARVLWEILRVKKLNRTQGQVSQVSGMGMEARKLRDERRKAHHLTMAVCHIVLCSFIAFGIMTFLAVLHALINVDKEESAVYRLFKAGMMGVQYVNSSINHHLLLCGSRVPQSFPQEDVLLVPSVDFAWQRYGDRNNF
jgi:hypothetical protein